MSGRKGYCMLKADISSYYSLDGHFHGCRWSLLMKKIRITAILLLILFNTTSLSGCTLIAGNERVYFYERPAIGFTVKDEVITDVDLEKQNSINLTAGDGIISITPYDGDQLQIIEKRKLTGPSTKKVLQAILEGNKLKIEKDTIKVKLNNNPEEKQKPLTSLIINIELKVPDTLTTLEIVSKSGEIKVSGLNKKDSMILKVDKGNIDIDNCKATWLSTSITNGNLDVVNFEGTCSYKCGRGNIKLQNTKGNIDLKSVSGDTVIDNAEGQLVCDISAGNLTVLESHIRADTSLYASYGDIKADLNTLNNEGKYTIKASKGNIRLKLSETAGWSLLAKSTKGRITVGPGLEAGVLKTAPTGNLYGDVRGGGPLIDVYVDMGNITLN
jgi:hypothetical protein